MLPRNFLLALNKDALRMCVNRYLYVSRGSFKKAFHVPYPLNFYNIGWKHDTISNVQFVHSEIFFSELKTSNRLGSCLSPWALNRKWECSVLLMQLCTKQKVGSRVPPVGAQEGEAVVLVTTPSFCFFLIKTGKKRIHCSVSLSSTLMNVWNCGLCLIPNISISAAYMLSRPC